MSNSSLSIILMFCGICCFLYFVFEYDPSYAVKEDQKVYYKKYNVPIPDGYLNLGLLQNRAIGCFAGGVLFLAGAAVKPATKYDTIN